VTRLLGLALAILLVTAGSAQAVQAPRHWRREIGDLARRTGWVCDQVTHTPAGGRTRVVSMDCYFIGFDRRGTIKRSWRPTRGLR